MAKTILIPASEIPVRETCDVFVAGGGTAGVAAAIASARRGARVVLVEQLPLPIGTVANGGNVANSYYSSWTPEDPSTKRIVEGIAKEIQERVTAAGGSPGPWKVDEATNGYHRPYVIRYDPETYCAVVCEMLLEAGVKVFTHTFFSDVVIGEDGRVTAAVIQNKEGRTAVEARYFIDCTGDGDLAVKAGVPSKLFYQEYNVRPLNSTCKVVGFGQVDLKAFAESCRKAGIIREIQRGRKFSDTEDIITLSVSFLLAEPYRTRAQEAGFTTAIFQSMHQNTIDSCQLNKGNVNILDIEEYSLTEMELQIKALKFLHFLKDNFDGFEHAYISRSGNSLGIRASRVVETEFVPTIEEMKASARYEDEIGNYGHSDFAPADEYSVFHDKGFYGLPYRMILPNGPDNVLVSGRMVGTNLRNHMSVRNTISCMIQGQAAGTAAALCLGTEYTPRTLPYELLRAALVEDNVHFEPMEEQ